MPFPWDDSRRAFADAAGWFVRTAALVGDRWTESGLGEWDVRALVGHTSRSLLTVEAYLDRPAAAVADIAARVVPIVGSKDGTELLTTVAGGMRLVDYLPTRIFELVVHTC